MNNEILAGNWKQFKGTMLQHWGKLTNDDLEVAAGRRSEMLGRLQERYGLAIDEAEKQLDEFEKTHKAAYSSRFPK